MAEIFINKKLCKGCGICIAFCPNKVFEKGKKMNVRGVYPPEPIHAEKCPNCGLCMLLCPDFAIAITT